MFLSPEIAFGRATPTHVSPGADKVLTMMSIGKFACASQSASYLVQVCQRRMAIAAFALTPDAGFCLLLQVSLCSQEQRGMASVELIEKSPLQSSKRAAFSGLVDGRC